MHGAQSIVKMSIIMTIIVFSFIPIGRPGEQKMEVLFSVAIDIVERNIVHGNGKIDIRQRNRGRRQAEE